MNETLLQVIFYVVVFLLYMIFGGKKKKTPPRMPVSTPKNALNTQPTTKSKEEKVKDLLADFLKNLEIEQQKTIVGEEKSLEVPSTQAISSEKISTNIHSLEQEATNYDQKSRIESYEFGNYKTSNSPIKINDPFFVKSQKDLFTPANRHLTHQKKNMFKEFLKDKNNLKKSFVLQDVFQRKF